MVKDNVPDGLGSRTTVVETASVIDIDRAYLVADWFVRIVATLVLLVLAYVIYRVKTGG